MGYHTRYKLEYHAEPEIMADIKEYIEAHSNMAYAIVEGQESKWYHWREDMCAMSKAYPTTTFILKGEGEESGDIWRAKIQNGVVKLQKAKIAFDEEL